MAKGPGKRHPKAQWSEAMRRLDILKTYDGLDRPTVEDADESAAAIGINRRQFYNLVWAYRSHREHLQKHPPKRVSATLEQVIDEAVSDAAPGASLSSVTRAAQDLAEARGLRRPAAKTVKIRLSAAAMQPRGEDESIIVDQASLLAPVEIDGIRVIPTVTIAIVRGLGIAAVDVADAGTPDADAVRSVVRRARLLHPKLNGRTVELVGIDAIQISEPGEPGRIERSTEFPTHGAAVSLLLMRRIAGIPTSTRLSTAAMLERTAHLPATTIPILIEHLRRRLEPQEPD